MVSHDLFWRILRLHRHGQVVVTYRPHSVPAERLAGYFAKLFSHELAQIDMNEKYSEGGHPLKGDVNLKRIDPLFHFFC